MLRYLVKNNREPQKELENTEKVVSRLRKSLILTSHKLESLRYFVV